MSTVRRTKATPNPKAHEPEVPQRVLLLLLAAGAVGYGIYKFPGAATPVLVILAALAALDRLIRR